MRRILQVITDTDRRGAQVFAMDLHTCLSDRGHAVHTVALKGSHHMGGLDVAALGPARLHPRTLAELRREIARASVVIGHGSTTLVACALAGAGTGTPFIYRQISDQLFWAGTPARRLRVRAYLRRVQAVVALWPGAADVLVSHFGVPRERIHVIPNGVPAARFPMQDPAGRPAARGSLGLDPTRPTALCIGALVPEKGVDLAVRAAGAANHQLVVAGDGPERSRLERLAEEVAAGCVHFVGTVKDPKTVLAAVDAVVMPSRGGDSMPAVLIEAGFCGLPAVATPVGAIPQVVIHDRTGKVVPVEDHTALARAIDEVLRSPHGYGTAARRHCLERFEIGVVTAAWEGLLDQLLATGPSPG